MKPSIVQSVLNKEVLILVGAEPYHRIETLKMRELPRTEMGTGCFESEALCRFQARVHGEGYKSARLELSKLGWTVRNASGLNNFELIASVRRGEVDGSFKDALMAATKWQAEDHDKRSVIIMKSDYEQI